MSLGDYVIDWEDIASLDTNKLTSEHRPVGRGVKMDEIVNWEAKYRELYLKVNTITRLL